MLFVLQRNGNDLLNFKIINYPLNKDFIDCKLFTYKAIVNAKKIINLLDKTDQKFWMSILCR